MKTLLSILILAIALSGTGCQSRRVRDLEARYAAVSRQLAESAQNDYLALTTQASTLPEELDLDRSYYRIQLPEHEVDGIKIDAHERVVEIVE